jgi:hypothetical protein
MKSLLVFFYLQTILNRFLQKLSQIYSQVCYNTHAITATQQANAWAKGNTEILSQKQSKNKRAESITQMVEHVPTMWEDLCSSPNTPQKSIQVQI